MKRFFLCIVIEDDDVFRWKSFGILSLWKKEAEWKTNSFSDYSCSLLPLPHKSPLEKTVVFHVSTYKVQHLEISKVGFEWLETASAIPVP